MLGIDVQSEISASRTPLHIDFPRNKGAGDFAPPYDVEDLSDPEEFNAIGSRVQAGGPTHLPIIDADGGAILQAVKGSKVILGAVYDNCRNDDEPPAYRPRSLLRDVLGDNGIDLEVFDQPEQKWSSMMQSYHTVGQRVTSIVLRAPEEGAFDVVDSTHDGHSHVYIQHNFQELDHRTLIAELGNIGIISRAWQELTQKENQGFLRAPWVEKSVAHMPS